MAKKRIPRRTPAEEAEFDRRTRELEQHLAERLRKTELLKAEQARIEERRRRLKRVLTLGLSS